MSLLKEYNLCSKPTSCQRCDSKSLCEAWVDFVKEHNTEKAYSHFDKRVSLAMPSIRRYVLSSEAVAAHSFYPFIHFQKKNSRFGKKGPKKPRELYYCSHLDRCVYQRYAFLLNYYYNDWARNHGIDNVAIAYRDNLGKNNIDFAQDAISAITRFEKGFIFVGDFTNFFDNLDHQYLKEMVCKILNVDRMPDDYFAIFKNITRFSSWDWKDILVAAGESINEPGIRTKMNQKDVILSKEQFQEGKKYIRKNTSGVGIPQGSPISAILSNIYMAELDSELQEFISDHSGVYMRYSDDFIIILPYTSSEDIEKYKNYLTSFFESKHHLITLQKEKTESYVYEQNQILSQCDMTPACISYLGFLFDGENIKLRPRAITKYYYRMRRKARTIRERNGISPKGKHISAKELYRVYSSGGDRQTFIDYAKRAKSQLNLTDPEADAVITRHKEKIALAIKKK